MKKSVICWLASDSCPFKNFSNYSARSTTSLSSGRGQGEGESIRTFSYLILLTPTLSIRSIAIYTAFFNYKYNELQSGLAPSPAGEGWGEENKNNPLYPPRQLLLHCSTSCIHASRHPNPLPQRRRGRYLCRYLCHQERGSSFSNLRFFQTR